MTWSARQLAGLCCRAGCPLKPGVGMNHCSVHRDEARMYTQRSMWRKRLGGPWRQERLHVIAAICSGDSVIHIAVSL
jgi:hypothetical protein